MPQNPPSQNSVRFGPFELDAETGELRKYGTRLKLSGQAIRVLSLLTASPGDMISRESLKQALWPGAQSGDFEHGLNAAVNRLREVLGDSATEPIYIQTVPGRGYRFIGPMDEGELSGAEVLVAIPPPPRKTTRMRWIIAFAVTVSLVLAAFLFRASIERLWRLYQRQRMTVVRLTSLPGNVASPTFSPDGSQLAFAWDPDGTGFDLYVKALGSDEPHRLTRHSSSWFSLAWAPNGQTIATARVQGTEASGIYLISPSGGPERKIADRSERKWYGTEVSWSPDSKRLAYIDRPGSDSPRDLLELYVLSIDTLEKKRVETGCFEVGTPAFSPTGRYLAWVCNRGMCDSSIELLRLNDQQRSRVYKGTGCILGLGWSKDERRIVFSTTEDSGALREIDLRQPNCSENLTIGQQAADLAVQPQGNGVAYVKGAYNATIWRVDLSTSPPQARRVIASSQMDRAPSISPDGTKIAFESTRSGNTEVWMSDADGSNALQLTSFANITGTPRWSPDGKLIAFDSRVEGEANLYLVRPDGGIPHKIDIDVHGNSQPSWSHDGKWLYFVNGDDAGKPSVWKVPISGGHALQMTGLGTTYPQESADGTLLYYVRGGTLWSVHPDGSGEQIVEGMPKMNFLGDEWFPAKEGIYFMALRDHKNVIEVFNYRTRTVRPVFTPERQTPPWIGAMPVSLDSKWLLYPQVDFSSSDLMMLENWK